MKLFLCHIFACLALGLGSCVDMHEAFRDQVNSEFPLHPGSRWTYVHVDSLARVRDTLRVVISSERPMNDGSYEYVWTFSSPAAVTPCYVLLSGTTIYIREKFFAATSSGKIAFPLKDSDRPRQSVVTPAGSFPHCFVIVPDRGIGNNWSGFRFWVQPGIGIVKAAAHDILAPFRHRSAESWELVSYALM